MHEISTSRRHLLGGVLGGSLVAGFASVAQAQPRAREVASWDEEWDTIIVGSGFAGLAAAYEAQCQGVKKILVLEKMEAYGGNSALCGALMCMPGTKMQKSKGIKDSPDLLVQDMLKAGRGFNHLELTQTLAENAYKAYDMLVDCGVEFQDKVIRLGGHSAPRAHLPKVPSGGAIVVPMHKYLKGKGVRFRNRTLVEELVRRGETVTGVIVRKGYDWHDKSDRGMLALRARYGVIVATGGWGQDNQFVTATMPAYKNLECTSQPGSTAEMIKALLAAGALPVMLDMFQLGPWASPDEKGAGPGSFFCGLCLR